MKRACELCNRTARLHCESDQASLCWDCDAKVHSANFLVARHSRTLLCRVCQLPTSWFAAGSKLEPTFSDCRKCMSRTGYDEREGENGVVAEEEREVIENQVSPPPPASESSFSGGEAAATRKRRRLGNDHIIHPDLNISTPPFDTAAEMASGAESLISRVTAAQSRKIERRVPCDDEVKAKTAKKLHGKEAIPNKEKAENPIGDAVDLNLSLSLFKR